MKFLKFTNPWKIYLSKSCCFELFEFLGISGDKFSSKFCNQGGVLLRLYVDFSKIFFFFFDKIESLRGRRTKFSWFFSSLETYF